MHMKSSVEMFAFIVLIALLNGKADGLLCYRCSSTNNTNPFQCNEMMTNDIDIEPESCDNVFGAKYCVKHVGRFEALSLDCYQCMSEDEWKCSDGELVKNALQPTNCSHVFEAQYCIKTIGRYGGGIGTKRFCSALHMGNYCDYVKQQGDKLTYRTCVYTCTGDGCNPASISSPSKLVYILSSGFLITVWLTLKR